MATARPFFLPITRSLPYDLPLGRIPFGIAANAVFQEFYCDPVGGNNMNGGSDEGSPSYTSTNGNWNGTTTFIPTDGSNPYLTVRPGQYAGVFNDGATTPVYVAQVLSAQNAVNGSIVLSSTKIAGTAPTSSATARSIRVGGAFKGPTGAEGWPIRVNFGAATDTAGHNVRINFKNTAAYAITAAINGSPSGGLNDRTIFQGYASTPGDEGKATIDGGTNNITLMQSTTGIFIDFQFSNNGTSGSQTGVSPSTPSYFYRCAFRHFRGQACVGANAFVECEFEDWNQSNTASSPAISYINITFVYRCYFHDATAGANCIAITASNVSWTPPFLINECIFDNISGDAFQCTTNQSAFLHLYNNLFYKVAGNVVNILTGGSNYSWVQGFNNIMMSCSGSLIKNAANGLCRGMMFNTVYGSGRYANRASLFVNSTSVSDISPIILPPDVSPFNSIDTGDFSLVYAPLIGTGRSKFLQVGSKTGTTSYIDIGATQAQPTVQSWNIGTGTQTLPYGYVNHFYAWKWYFNNPVTVTRQSGSLPPGLVLSQAGPQVIYILGTPTTIGTYDFVLRASSGTAIADANFEISIYADPDEGIGGLLGGLRPTC